jgi:demethylmenaquinone methyltransferase/2-methoxy-6-polyprenyl-1,4-benzoquinol methylase
LLAFRRPVKFRAMTSTGLGTVEARAAAGGGTEKSGYVRRMFSDIAPRYDFLNHLLSFSLDRYWRRAALRELAWRRQPEGVYLDLCAGTLDVAALLARQPGFRGQVIGADFAEPMLRLGSGKAPAGVVSPVGADAQSLPLATGSAHGAIVAFGIRNVADLDECLREVHRVLSTGGRFVILEFTTPRNALVRAAFHLYFHRVVPLVGRLVSGHPTAYRYLPDSVAAFPGPGPLADRLRAAGFTNVVWRVLTFGTVAIHVGER